MPDRSASTRLKPQRARRPVIPDGSLGTVLARLPRPWSVFRHWQFSAFDADHGQGGGGLYIVLHPAKGIALVDSDLAAPFSALLRLRHLLQATQFEPFLHNQPPVVALALNRDELGNIEHRLSKAFASAGPCQISDANWTTVVVTAIASLNLQLMEVKGGTSGVSLRAASAESTPSSARVLAPAAAGEVAPTARPEPSAPAPAQAREAAIGHSTTAASKSIARATQAWSQLCLRLRTAPGELLERLQSSGRGAARDCQQLCAMLGARLGRLQNRLGRAAQSARRSTAQLLGAASLCLPPMRKTLRDIGSAAALVSEVCRATAARATSQSVRGARRSLHHYGDLASHTARSLRSMGVNRLERAQRGCERGSDAALTRLHRARAASLARCRELHTTYCAAIERLKARASLPGRSRAGLPAAGCEAQESVPSTPTAASEHPIRKLSAAMAGLQEVARRRVQTLRIKGRSLTSLLATIPIRAPTRFERGSIALGLAGTSLGVIAALVLIRADDSIIPAVRTTPGPVPIATKPLSPSDAGIPLQPPIAPPPFAVRPAAIPQVKVEAPPPETRAAASSKEASTFARGEVEATGSSAGNVKKLELARKPAPARSEKPIDASSPPAPVEVVTLPPLGHEMASPKRERRVKRAASPYDGPEFDYANRQAH